MISTTELAPPHACMFMLVPLSLQPDSQPALVNSYWTHSQRLSTPYGITVPLALPDHHLTTLVPPTWTVSQMLLCSHCTTGRHTARWQNMHTLSVLLFHRRHPATKQICYVYTSLSLREWQYRVPHLWPSIYTVYTDLVRISKNIGMVLLSSTVNPFSSYV